MNLLWYKKRVRERERERESKREERERALVWFPFIIYRVYERV